MKVMIRFILPSTDTPWQKAEELGLKDKLAMKVGTVMIVMMVMKVDTGVHWTVIFLVVEHGRGRYKYMEIPRWTREILIDTLQMVSRWSR